MALKTDIRGMVWPYPDTFVVGREEIRLYAKAVKATDAASFDEAAAEELGHPGLVAPLTFASKFALIIQNHFFRHVDLGLESKAIVHVDQKFVYHRPVMVGDALHGTLYVESVDERFGADIVVARSACADDDGELVIEAFSTLISQQADDLSFLTWDPVTGQHRRAPAYELEDQRLYG